MGRRTVANAGPLLLKVLPLLMAALPVYSANGSSSFSLACSFRGGKASFVVSGDYTTQKAGIIGATGSVREAQVSFEMGVLPPPTLAILVRGKGNLGDWRDLYIVGAAGGPFTHINEIWADGPDKAPFMAVQSGVCAAPAEKR